MVFFPSVNSVKASLDPNGSRYWIGSASDKIKDEAAHIKHAIQDETAAIVKPHHKVELYSAEYYKYCTIGGIFACGPTHAAVTPLDLAKVRIQVNAGLYKGTMDAWKTIVRTEGAGAILTGFGATLLGYSLQGAGKYGFYEFFKQNYSLAIGEEAATKYKTGVYLIASASAELIADVLLCPWEAIKVRTQTTMPPYASNLFSGFTKFVASDGFAGLYAGLVPLWARQIPYTMVKFATFENIVAMIYSYLPKKKEEMSLASQTGVSFLGGYLAGIFCAVVSHPADVMVSKINASKQEGEAVGAAISRIYSQIGFAGLWGGLGTRIVMVGTLTGLQWLLYDSFKAYVGLPTTGSAAPPKESA